MKERKSRRTELIQGMLDLPRLSSQEQAELCLRAQHGDMEARARLVASVSRMVLKRVWKYWRVAETDDLFSAGLLGVHRAIDAFDPAKGKFATYAIWFVRTELNQVVQTGHRHSVVSMAHDSRERHRYFRANLPRDLSLQETVDEEERVTRQDLLTEPDTDPEFFAANHEHRRQSGQLVRRSMQGLKPREVRVVEDRFLCEEPSTLEQLSQELGCSRENVRLIQNRALKKMLRALGSSADLQDVLERLKEAA